MTVTVSSGLTDTVRKLFERHREVRISLEVSIEKFARSMAYLELYHDAEKKYGAELSEHTFLSVPFSLGIADQTTQEIYQALRGGQKAQFKGELIVAWDRLKKLLGQDTRAGISGELTVGKNKYSTKFNVESFPMVPPLYHIYAVEIKKS